MWQCPQYTVSSGPSASNVSGFAPYLSNRMTIERWPCLVAQWIGVEVSSPPLTLGLAPFCIHVCTTIHIPYRVPNTTTASDLYEVRGNCYAIVDGRPVKSRDILAVSLAHILTTHLHQIAAPAHTMRHPPHYYFAAQSPSAPLKVTILCCLNQRKGVWIQSSFLPSLTLLLFAFFTSCQFVARGLDTR